MSDQSSTVFSALRTQVDDPIGVPDYIQVVLDDDDRVAQISEPMQHIQQFLYIFEVQACRRLVEQIQSASSLAFAQLPRQLYALSFAA